MRSSIYVSILGFCLIFPALSGMTASKSLKAQTKNYCSENSLAGVSICRLSHTDTKRPKKEVAFAGYANLELNVKLGKNSVHRIASISKVFTALSIMRLQEKGMLNTSDTFAKYFPDFQRSSEFTLKQMLQHTSGLPAFEAMAAFGENQAKQWTPEELMALVAKEPFKFNPGANASYSNTGFVFLAMVIEKVTGKSYAQVVKDEVVTPLGMRLTRVGSDDDIIPGRVSGYSLENDAVENCQMVSVVAPFGTGDIMSTPDDLVLLCNAFTAGFTYLSQASISEMTAMTALADGSTWKQAWAEGLWLSFGYGLELFSRSGDFGSDMMITKNGGISGFRSQFIYSPLQNKAIALIQNTEPEDENKALHFVLSIME